jgi:hypothetical protein
MVHRAGIMAATAGAALLLAACAGEAPGEARPAPDVVRGLNGTWESYPQRSFGLGGPEAERPVPPPAPVPEPPLKPDYLETWRAEQARNAELTRQGLPPVSSGMACLPEGMPAMMLSIFPMEVLETPGQVTIVQEAFNQVRRIYLDEEPLAPEDAEPRFSGHSVGRWEGDTLVVETVGVKDYVRFRNVPHSMGMRVTERISLVHDEIMQNQVTVEDPEFLTGPWTWTWMYRRWPGYRIQEYVCEDNRYFEDPALEYQRLRVD